MPNCCWIPIPKFHVLMFSLSLVAGPLKNWTVQNQPNFLFYPFEACDRVKRILRFFKKLKMKLNSKKYLFWPCTVHKQFCPFWENKNEYYTNCFSNFLLVDCSLMYILERFYKLKKILIFKVPVIFWKWKVCSTCGAHAWGQNCQFFGIEFQKILLISSVRPKLPIFWNRVPKNIPDQQK